MFILTYIFVFGFLRDRLYTFTNRIRNPSNNVQRNTNILLIAKQSLESITLVEDIIVIPKEY